MSHAFEVEPQTPRRQIRHRSSLEHVLDFSFLSPLPDPHDITEATLLYHRILDDCEADNVILRDPSDTTAAEVTRDVIREAALAELNDLEDFDNDDDHSGEDDAASPTGVVCLHKFFRCIYEYCPEPAGQSNLVRIVLHGLFPPSIPNDTDAEQRSLRKILPRARTWLSATPDQKAGIYNTLARFANDFMEGFFVPFKAQGRCTPAASTLITPTSRSEPGADQGTPNRLHNLRALCLARDGNRCVVTRRLDSTYLQDLYTRSGSHRAVTAAKTEAAHIIPHSLNALAADATELHPSKCTVWRILNMFDPGISRVLAGSLIDSPSNAMIMIPELHHRFGRLQCYLQEVPGQADTYSFHSTRGAAALDRKDGPRGRNVVFVNHETDGVKAELPSARLLKIHRACCLMLAMSGAGEYVERLLRDAERLLEHGVLASDGSSNFALIMKLRGLEEAMEGVVETWDVGRRVAVMV